MRPFLLAIVFSAIALAPNVLVVSPESTGMGEGLSAASGGVEFIRGTIPVEQPPVSSAALLVAGLAGLTLAGGRRSEEAEAEAAA